MRTADPMPELERILKDRSAVFKVLTPIKTRSKPKVEINQVGNQYLITFHLKKILDSQKFLGIYPTAANLPNADGLNSGDYALLQSGEVVQIHP